MSTQDALAQISPDAVMPQSDTPNPDAPIASPASPPPTVLSRQVILDATARALADVGYDGTTIRKIASLLNCAVGSIYRYFKDKRQLLSAVAQQRFDGAAAVIESGGSFEKSVQAYVDAAIGEPQTYRLMFWLACVRAEDEDGQPGPMIPDVVATIINGWGHRLGDAPLAQQVWAVLHGSIMLGQNREQILAAAEQLFVHHTAARQGKAEAPPVAVARPKAAIPQTPVRVDASNMPHTASNAATAAVTVTAGKSTAPAEVTIGNDKDDVCML